jgi:hypothetical protein
MLLLDELLLARLERLFREVPGPLHEPEQMLLHPKDPAHGDQLRRPAQDLSDPDGEEVALVEEIGHSRSVRGGPIAQPVKADVLIVFEDRRCEGAEPLPRSAGLLHNGHRDGRGCSGGPIDVVQLSDLPLKLVQLLRVVVLERIELRSRLRLAPLALVAIVRPHEFSEEGRARLLRRSHRRACAVAVLARNRRRGVLGHVEPRFCRPTPQLQAQASASLCSIPCQTTSQKA